MQGGGGGVEDGMGMRGLKVWLAEARCTHVIAEQDSVEELQHADHDEKGHEGVEEEGARGRVLPVVVPDVQGDVLRGGSGGEGGRGRGLRGLGGGGGRLGRG